MGTAVMMLGFGMLSIILIILIAHNHADIDLILNKLNADNCLKGKAESVESNDYHRETESELVALLKKYHDKDIILGQKRKVDGIWLSIGYYYADAKGSPLKMLDADQKYYFSSECGEVYWNPTRKDMVSDSWYLVREGKPLGVNDTDGGGLVVLREGDIEEKEKRDNSDNI